MALTYSAAIQNRIAVLVFGIEYSALASADKLLLDNNWTTGAVGGVVGDVLQTLGEYAQFVTLDGTRNPPDQWESWWVALSAKRVGANARPDRMTFLKEVEEDAAATAIDLYLRNSTTYNPASVTEAQDLTVQSIRNYVWLQCVRRKPRIFPSAESIDTAIFDVINHIWNHADWVFRRRRVTLTVPTSGTPAGNPVTDTLSGGETIGNFNTRMLWYTDGGGAVQWVSADGAAMMKASFLLTKGRPQFVRAQQSSGTWSFEWFPEPDASYTLYAEVNVAGPGFPSSATDTTVFAKFPTPFRTIIKEAVLAKVLINLDARDGVQMWQRTQDAIDRLLPKYADIGELGADVSVRDVYGDAQALTGFQNRLGGGL